MPFKGNKARQAGIHFSYNIRTKAGLDIIYFKKIIAIRMVPKEAGKKDPFG